jgi:hypothetical protein
MTHSDDHENLTTRGMLMDDSPTPALYTLTRPLEIPPTEADEFDAHFALMDDRDRAHLGDGTNIVRQAAREPQEIRETPPE